ncbi:alpha/beta fold hydrolase [Rhodococcoides kroppenstedtii]|uniref:alpha/beta fold hydrolase n=1 Tax=Rhodococcoides kroppenstedtii TaxID=293050 RepID=UPI001C9A569B|nr:alpha/beta hydrolase [Rhodococcus kroppenstedtii]MBY6437948.1 alpha/beta hydrolase [Rhodococcus kroppenstedtii]
MDTSWWDLPDVVPVSVDGADVATVMLGPSTEEAAGDVVFCHGTPWSSAVWGAVARRVARTHRVFLWDMPGYGRSTMNPDTPIDLAAQGSRLAALLDHWGLDRPNLVAHDVGGAVALRAHLLHDRDAASVFLWDVVTLDPWGSPFFALVRDHVDVFSALPERLHGALVREYIAGAGPRLTAESIERLAAPWLGDAGRLAFYRQIGALRPEHTRPVVARLADTRCPASVGWGEDDPWIPVAQAHRLADALPGDPPVITLPGVGHLAPVEASEQVADAVLAHLRRVTP